MMGWVKYKTRHSKDATQVMRPTIHTAKRMQCAEMLKRLKACS